MPCLFASTLRYIALCLTPLVGPGCAGRPSLVPPIVFRNADPLFTGSSVHLNIGDSAVILVNADNPRNQTGLLMKKDEVYDFICPGRQVWNDGGVPVMPNGDAATSYKTYMSIYSKMMRLPHSPALALIGETTPDERDAFEIGSALKGRVVTMTGELICFANDVPHFYFNNSGAITVVVMRKR